MSAVIYLLCSPRASFRHSVSGGDRRRETDGLALTAVAECETGLGTESDSEY